MVTVPSTFGPDRRKECGLCSGKLHGKEEKASLKRSVNETSSDHTKQMCLSYTFQLNLFIFSILSIMCGTV